MDDSTRTIHPERVKVDEDNSPLVYPAYQSVKFSFPNFGELEKFFAGKRRGFSYARVSNPTVEQLVQEIAALQGTEGGLAFASGIAGIHFIFMSLLSQGDHVVAFVQSYKPTRTILRSVYSKFGVRVTLVNAGDYQRLEEVLRTTPTRLVFFESLTNPTVQVVDVARVATLARKNGALCVLDNTMAGYHQFRDAPVDLFLHSLTKYVTGIGDVSGGMLLGSRSMLRSLRHHYVDFGAALDPYVASLMERGLNTYHLRYAAQSQAAGEIAAWLERHPFVKRVSYPGLPSHPQHDLAKSVLKHFGTIISIDLAGGADVVPRVLDSLKLFKVAGSFGSVDSLAAPSLLFYGGELTTEEIATSGIGVTTLRLSIGLESVEDLKTDLATALQVVASPGGP